jgi:outer membrane cobalamin receptor
MAGFSVTKNLHLRAFYKDIFRNPTFNEQYYFAVVQSRNIKPEDTKQFDAGFTYNKNFSGLFSYIAFTADGYYNTVSNKIIAIPNKNPAISSILNLGSVDIKGVDVGMKTQAVFSPMYKAVFSANYTYQQALDVTDPTSDYYKNQIPYTPQSTIAFNAGIIREGLGIYYNQVTSADRYFLSENQPQNLVPGYSVSDISAVYHFTIKAALFNVSAALENLFDTNYVVVRSFPMPGRSLRFSVQITI